MPDEAVAAKDLWKSYDGTSNVLQGAHLTVSKAETLVVWGENGSGKTTLLSILGGLDVPDRGIVRIGGREIAGLTERDRAAIRLREIGFVFQTHQLLSDLSVEDNLALPLRLARKSPESRVAELLQAFGITRLAKRRPAQISVGESQRVAVARALANGPKVVLADEPTAALDAKGIASVLEAFGLARTSFDAAIVLASHDSEVRALHATTVELRDGLIRPIFT